MIILPVKAPFWQMMAGPLLRLVSPMMLLAGLCWMMGSVAPLRAEETKQVKVDASYVVSISGIRIGSGQVKALFQEGSYAISVAGQTDSVGRLVSSGHGSGKAQGYLSADRPLSESYNLKSREDDKDNQVTMSLRKGDIATTKAEPPQEPHPHRIPVNPSVHHRNIIDPISALIMPASSPDRAEGPEGCNRTLSLFDGRQRYDIVLSYVRTELVETEDFKGLTLVCQANYRPIAGHRDNRKINQDLSENQDIFVWITPVGRTGILMPWRLEVGLKFGRLILQAKYFKVSGPKDLYLATAP
jgi:hypothetical protein